MARTKTIQDFSGSLTVERARVRRISVWDLKLRGWSDQEISDDLNISVNTVRADLKDQRKILDEAADWTAKDALNAFLEQTNRVIRLATDRMEREEKMEDDYQITVDNILNMPPGPTRPTIPMPPRTSHAAYIAEIRKANENFGKVTGILKENHSITVTLMSNDELIREALKAGIDVSQFGIDVKDDGTPFLLNEAAEQMPILEGTYTVSESTYATNHDNIAPVPTTVVASVVD